MRRSFRRLGIDVGGTHTDAVLVDGDEIVAATKALTSKDVLTGVTDAIDAVLSDAGDDAAELGAIMLGTTQFTNAVVERRELEPVAAIRVGLPSGDGLPPKIGWPDDIANSLGDEVHQLHGGTLYDGWALAELNDREIDQLARHLASRDVRSICVSAVFSPMNPQPEVEVGRRLSEALPNARVTLSHTMGGLGLLERENAALLNTALLPFADRVVSAFIAAMSARQLSCPLFISQNDGTLMDAEFARDYPALTFASGPTNSLRGACRLSGLDNAIVVDIGGTTSDIGILQNGFPRQSNTTVDVGGVRTNFRMPDILAVGLGGGSRVSADGRKIGPTSVGHRLVEEGLVFGGGTLTATDIVVAAGGADIGDRALVADLDKGAVQRAEQTIADTLNIAVDSMKPNADPIPVVLVGGGAVLVNAPLSAASEIIRPHNAGVANAIGAAIAQIGGESEAMLSVNADTRDAAISAVTRQATEQAVKAGADRASLRVVDVEETALAYTDTDTTRVRVKVVGEVAGLPR